VVGSLANGWQVRAAVADRDVVRLAIGDRAQVTFDAFPGQAFAARVLRLAAASDAATGTYDVELAVDPADPIRRRRPARPSRVPRGPPIPHPRRRSAPLPARDRRNTQSRPRPITRRRTTAHASAARSSRSSRHRMRPDRISRAHSGSYRNADR
jgi:hypothetical protein